MLQVPQDINDYVRSIPREFPNNYLLINNKSGTDVIYLSSNTCIN